VNAADDLSGLIFPALPGHGIDHLQALWAKNCARAAADLLAGAEDPVSISLANTLARTSEPARVRLFAHPLASLDTAIAPPNGLTDARGPAERRCSIARHLIGAPDVEDLTLILTGRELLADLMMPHLGIILRAPGDRAVAVRQTGGRVTLVRDDGLSATFAAGIPAPPGAESPLFASSPRIGSLDLLNADPATAAFLAPFGLAQSEELTGAKTRIAEGLRLMAEVWPAAHSALVRHVRGLVLLSHRGYERSDSPKSLCGAVVMTAGMPETIGDLLCHEASHVRMHWAKAVDPLVKATDPEAEASGFESPWRPDLRPLDGLLLGVHAFLNVCEWYRRLSARGDASQNYALRIFERQAENTRRGWETLSANGAATAAGAALFDEFQNAVAALPTREHAHA
jgi:HEXXH motif-containing protein